MCLWAGLIHDSDKWQIFVNTVTNIWVRQKTGKCLFQRIYRLITVYDPWGSHSAQKNVAKVIQHSDIHLPRNSLGVATRNVSLLKHTLFPIPSHVWASVQRWVPQGSAQCLDVSPIYRICPGTQSTPNVAGILTIFPSAATAACRVSRQSATSGEDSVQ